MRRLKTYEAYESLGQSFLRSIKKEILFIGETASGVLIIAKDTKRVLLVLREDCSEWGIISGKSEPGEDFEDTIIRELKEETCYQGNIRLIESHLYKKDMFKFQNYIGIVSTEFTPILNEENIDYKWVNIESLYEINTMHFGLKSLLENAHNQIFKTKSNL
jgi:8-oxo-dGTP pyrophosphatase MutT (NUDIX family)